MADSGVEVTELDLRDDRVAARVHAVGLRAYRVEADLIGFDGIPALGESMARMRALPLRWLGVAAPEPVAFLAYTTDDVVDVDRLCVDPDRFRRGLARALLTALLERTTGDVVVSTGAANTPAITLYERAGFTHTGTVSPVAGLTIATFRLQRG
ncbi:GNAT family N-acetyltransferase [Actinokineospora spheciospongiae]|uniref:GNAT family N-acetyltransferase n=1 Tax=Actinokineospora spheciospongiae TaxID=909613 RepID=UPI000D71BB03|nr:GNAT family N-acetyltransferase [Actinokineospora spheciospongiae]PWW63073.1 acetyltransferase (GNAT) family protein [Actinokineospora spheciospongiae]